MISISESLKDLPILKHFQIGLNQISDKGIAEFSENLQYIPNLQSLYLSDNKIGDKGLISLSKHLKDIPNLNYFSIESIYIYIIFLHF